MARQHSERCKVCKSAFRTLLETVFGTVNENVDLGLPAQLKGYERTPLFRSLERIHESLVRHRGYEQFVRSEKLHRVDYFVRNPKQIVEFDESQHFTKPRGIACVNYPRDLRVGFDAPKWISLCQQLNKKDNQPAFRDEQRAWYDTLRDFAPTVLDLRPTIRVYVRDFVWCSLDPLDKYDRTTFLQILSRDAADKRL